MLVIGRRTDQEIIIDTGTDRITLLVVDIRRDQVRIGIKAPGHITVHRAEVQKLIDEQPTVAE